MKLVKNIKKNEELHINISVEVVKFYFYFFELIWIFKSESACRYLS
jgi:hypothetical protein